jgi:hypothetical protein
MHRFITTGTLKGNKQTDPGVTGRDGKKGIASDTKKTDDTDVASTTGSNDDDVGHLSPNHNRSKLAENTHLKYSSGYAISTNRNTANTPGHRHALVAMSTKDTMLPSKGDEGVRAPRPRCEPGEVTDPNSHTEGNPGESIQVTDKDDVRVQTKGSGIGNSASPECALGEVVDLIPDTKMENVCIACHRSIRSQMKVKLPFKRKLGNHCAIDNEYPVRK